MDVIYDNFKVVKVELSFDENEFANSMAIKCRTKKKDMIKSFLISRDNIPKNIILENFKISLKNE